MEGRHSWQALESHTSSAAKEAIKTTRSSTSTGDSSSSNSRGSSEPIPEGRGWGYSLGPREAASLLFAASQLQLLPTRDGAAWVQDMVACVACQAPDVLVSEHKSALHRVRVWIKVGERWLVSSCACSLHLWCSQFVASVVLAVPCICGGAGRSVCLWC